MPQALLFSLSLCPFFSPPVKKVLEGKNSGRNAYESSKQSAVSACVKRYVDEHSRDTFPLNYRFPGEIQVDLLVSENLIFNNNNNNRISC